MIPFIVTSPKNNTGIVFVWEVYKLLAVFINAHKTLAFTNNYYIIILIKYAFSHFFDAGFSRMSLILANTTSLIAITNKVGCIMLLQAWQYHIIVYCPRSGNRTTFDIHS